MDLVMCGSAGPARHPSKAPVPCVGVGEAPCLPTLFPGGRWAWASVWDGRGEAGVDRTAEGREETSLQFQPGGVGRGRRSTRRLRLPPATVGDRRGHRRAALCTKTSKASHLPHRSSALGMVKSAADAALRVSHTPIKEKKAKVGYCLALKKMERCSRVEILIFQYNYFSS